MCELASVLPGIEAGTSWGTPGLKVSGRFLARLKEDGESLVLRISFEERERLMARAPRVFYLTDHYQNYPAVLIHLAKVREGVLKRLLKDAWGEVAGERLLPEGRSGQRSRRPRTR